MFLKQLWISNFRNYTSCFTEFPPDGLTIIQGPNGQGKTNLLEAIGFTATLKSFRGAVPETLIKKGCDSSVIRGLGDRSGRELLIETELNAGRRGRTLVNKQSLQKVGDLADLLAVTIFSPDDLNIVKGGPAIRRQFIDDLLADGDKSIRAVQRDFDRVIKQRNMLLKQAGNRLTPDVALTLDVWDSKMSELGEALGNARQQLIEELQPKVEAAYCDLADGPQVSSVTMRVVSPWRLKDGGTGLAAALAEARKADLARQVTTVGPHRDEIELIIDDLPARTHASQGEQRTLTLALRLAGHRLITEKADSAPLLLLDDVFSELDADRARRLVVELPDCQTFLTTATEPPPGLSPQTTIHINNGELVA